MPQFNPANFEGRDRIAHIEEYLQSRIETAQRPQLQASAEGFVSQNFDRQAAPSVSIMIGGSAYAMLCPLRAGDVITYVYVQCTTAGTGTSLFKAGLFTTDGLTRLATSGDLSGSFAASGIKPINLTAPYTQTSDGNVMVAIVATTGTTMPTLLRGNSGGSGTGQALGTGAWPFANGGVALSDITPSLSLSTSASPIAYWVGLG